MNSEVSHLWANVIGANMSGGINSPICQIWLTVAVFT